MNLAALQSEASSLWWSLGGLIVLALLVVLMFNLFQGRRSRPRPADSSPDTDGAEPLAEAGGAGMPSRPVARTAAVSATEGRGTARIEPSLLPDPPELDLDPAARLEAQFPSEITDDPPAPLSPWTETPPVSGSTVQPPGSLASAARSGVTALRRPAGTAGIPAAAEWGVLDDRIDCIAVLQVKPPLDCIALRSGAQSLTRVGSKPVIAEVQLADGSWCDVRGAEGLAAALRLGILLANRQGPLNAVEFAEFAEKLRRLAGKLGVAELRLPETMGVLERARQVDEFCARLDTLIGVNVLAPQKIDASGLAGLADALQLAPRGHHRYARPAGSGDVLFTMTLAERPDMLTFVLDVPRAPAGEQPWLRMVECARRCAELLQGQVIDDAMAPLSEPASQAVARQLQSHYAQLAAAGLDAGGPAALRVFN
jgi:hypothetical protein